MFAMLPVNNNKAWLDFSFVGAVNKLFLKMLQNCLNTTVVLGKFQEFMEHFGCLKCKTKIVM